ncbi:MAG: type-F conjugative transfer system protein TraW [Gallionellaceae bacterium CG1_02_56_997]|nr:type-F conjugative transfer system protein TraW [Gallionella sp.]OIO82736.1 MAG: type-F conjugative transfer system protein TraW [Gallionellaceae bacterium CG1_02_56_997]PJC03337.1 MAG: type-F conjugative transfer system protein TraW [Gallionellales bacterium CG_4_9_14_0_8_um_filter_55_61]
MTRTKKYSFLAALLILPVISTAEDLGVVGKTYDITERDLIAVIQHKLKHMEKTGELAKFQNDYKNRVIDGIEHPKPIPGIKATANANTRYYDPSMVTDKDITDATGRILYPRGTRINPLDYIGWNKYLLFVDGRDAKQLEFSKKITAASDRPVKLVLVAGEPLDLMRKWKMSVYFDQGGKLTRRFAITQVPAIVRQEGKRLRIDELRY